MKNILYSIILCLLSTNLLADSTRDYYPNYFIENYSSEIHGGGNTTWGITQSSDGRMFFANNYGVLIFNGAGWESLETRNSRPARSILTDSQGQVIAGSKGDIGLISSTTYGNYIFKSLVELSNQTDLPDGSKDTVYEIHEISQNEFIYRTSENIFIYKNKKISALNNDQNIKFGVSKLINQKLYVYGREKGLFVYD